MKKKSILLIILFFYITSCVEEIPPISFSKSKIVVSCILTNFDVQKLILTYNKPMYSGQFFEEVEQAIVTLYKEDEVVGVFSKTGYAEWEMRYRPEAGKHYRLKIEIPGLSVLSANTIMPYAVKILRNATIDDNHTKVFTQRTLSNPFWIFCMKSHLINEEYQIHKPELAEDDEAQLFQQIGTNHINADRFNQEGLSSDFDSQYGKTLSYKFYVRIAPDKILNNKYPYVFCVQHPMTEASFVVFRTASEEYDRYLKSVIEKMTFYECEDDPAQWFDETVIYSNIKNGLGIFGAYQQEAFYYNNFFLDI